MRRLLFVDVDVGEEKIADRENEDRDWDCEAVEESAGDLLVVESRDDQVGIKTGVETGEVGLLLPILFRKHFKMKLNGY